MTEERKFFNKMYFDHFSNDEILKNFTNLIDVYHQRESGQIIDIGCGQSPYLLDLYKNSSFKLFAIDSEQLQIDLLKQRLSQINSEVNISFSTSEFPSRELEHEKFTGVILSNFLHFMTLGECHTFMNKVKKQAHSGCIFLVTVHSWKHHSRKKPIDFKHFFSKQDIQNLFPKSDFTQLYFESQSSHFNDRFKKFYKSFIKEWYNKNGIYNELQIFEAQNSFVKNSARTENITCVFKMK